MNRHASRHPEDWEDRVEAIRDQADIRREEMRERELRQEGEIEEDACICGYEGPDEFGNYDLLEDRRCPLHGDGQEDSGRLP